MSTPSEKRKASKVMVKSAYFSSEDLPIVEAVCREAGLTVGQLATAKARELSQDKALVLPVLVKELAKTDAEMVRLSNGIPGRKFQAFKEVADRIKSEHPDFTEAQLTSQFAREITFNPFVASYLALRQLNLQARGLYQRIQKIDEAVAEGLGS